MTQQQPETPVSYNNEMLWNSSDNVSPPENNNFDSVEVGGSAPPASNRATLIEPPSRELNTATAKPQDVFQDQYEKMETGLICSICFHLFIEPVTLNCSHTFCTFCITAWRDANSSCPICRTYISTTNRTLILDNVLAQMMERLSVEGRDEREAIIKERHATELEKMHLSSHTASPRSPAPIDTVDTVDADSMDTADSQVDTEVELGQNYSVEELINSSITLEEDIISGWQEDVGFEEEHGVGFGWDNDIVLQYYFGF